MGYVCYLADKRNSKRAYEMASAVLPSDMIAFFRSDKEGKEAAATVIDYITKGKGRGHMLGPKGEQIVYEMREVKLKAPVTRPNSLRDYITFEGHASFSGLWPLCHTSGIT